MELVLVEVHVEGKVLMTGVTRVNAWEVVKQIYRQTGKEATVVTPGTK